MLRFFWPDPLACVNVGWEVQAELASFLAASQPLLFLLAVHTVPAGFRCCCGVSDTIQPVVLVPVFGSFEEVSH